MALSRLILFPWDALITAEIPQTVLSIVAEDPDDDKFIECAVAAKAGYIVSGDQHLKAIKKYVGIKILSPKDLLGEYKKHKN